MTKEDYLHRSKDIQAQLSVLFNELETLDNERIADIEEYMEKAIGLHIGDSTIITINGAKIECTYNGVRKNCRTIYLEFTYPNLCENLEAGLNLAFAQMHPNGICTDKDFTFSVGEKQYSYKFIMSKFI